MTVSGGWIWNRAAKKAVYVPGKGINKPLFDTGALYDAFDYEVENAGKLSPVDFRDAFQAVQDQFREYR